MRAPVHVTAWGSGRSNAARAVLVHGTMTWGTHEHGFALRASTEAVGMPPLEPTPARLRAAATAMRERPSWEADVPLAELAASPFPKLVISGTWENAPAAYREAAGEALMACAAVVAEELGAEMLRVDGASHWPHAERPEVVNATLRRLWRSAAG